MYMLLDERREWSRQDKDTEVGRGKARRGRRELWKIDILLQGKESLARNKYQNCVLAYSITVSMLHHAAAVRFIFVVNDM